MLFETFKKSINDILIAFIVIIILKIYIIIKKKKIFNLIKQIFESVSIYYFWFKKKNFFLINKINFSL